MGSSASQQNLFSLLPKARAPLREFAFSGGAHACGLVFLLSLGLLHPAIIPSVEHTFRSVELVSTPIPVNHRSQPMRLPELASRANIDPPPTPLPPSPRLRTTVVENQPAPSVNFAPANPQIIPPNSARVTPKLVATNVFSSGNSVATSAMRAPPQVQTGGFGDSNGITAQTSPGKPINIASAGSFDLPSGPGLGNGSVGAKGMAGVVASSGFGNGTATGNVRVADPRGVQPSGFADAAALSSSAKQSPVEVSANPLLPAEIISKPTPSYTAEARNLRIQGEVLLEVTLEASGNLRVIRVVHGLGHGLDDNAVRAAEQIRFRPAMRNGQPADSTVVLHIVFQMA
jgi:TonB family protein